MSEALIIELGCGTRVVVDDDLPPDLLARRWFTWSRQRSLKRPTYVGVKIAGKNRLLHRVIFGASPGVQVDHINRDVLDNRRANLRLATRSQNGANRGLAANNRSGLKGVHLKGGRSWIAQIKVDGAKLHLGCFSTAQEAARAYDDAALTHFGAFAFINGSIHPLSRNGEGSFSGAPR